MSLYNYFLTNPFGPGARTLEWIYLDRTGGTDVDLDNEPTMGADDSGTNCRIVALNNTTAEIWQLIASTHVHDPTNGWVRPLDYDNDINPKVWKRLFAFSTGSGGGGTIEATTDLLEGDGAGNAVSSGVALTDVVLKQPAFPTPTTLNQVIACLQAAGLCV